MSRFPPVVWRWGFLSAVAAVLYLSFSAVFEPGQAILFTAVLWILVFSWVGGGTEPGMVPQDKVIIGADADAAYGTDGHELGNFDREDDWRE